MNENGIDKLHIEKLLQERVKKLNMLLEKNRTIMNLVMNVLGYNKLHEPIKLVLEVN